MVEIWNLNNPSEEPQEVTQREDRGRLSLLSFGFAGLIFMYSNSSLDARTAKDTQAKSRRCEGHLFCTGCSWIQRTILPSFWAELSTARLCHPSRARPMMIGCLAHPPLPQLTTRTDKMRMDNSSPSTPASSARQRPPSSRPTASAPWCLQVPSSGYLQTFGHETALDSTPPGLGNDGFCHLDECPLVLLGLEAIQIDPPHQDLPTSPIRSVAVGQAELVGQVRPPSQERPK